MPDRLAAERDGQVRLANTGRSRDILPSNSHSRLLSNTRIIHGLVSGCLRVVRFIMQAICIL
jgi:hypothetical protein